MNITEKLLLARQYMASEAGLDAPAMHASFEGPWVVIKSILTLMGYTFYQSDYDPQEGLQPTFAAFLAIDDEAHQMMLGEVLATICDAMGTHPECRGSDDAMTMVLVALSNNRLWRHCLAPGHDPHALARNLLLAAGGERNDKDAIERIRAEWLGVDLYISPKHLLETGTWQAIDDSIQKLASAMFGEHWWMFNAPDKRTFLLLNADIVIQQRPDFCPGLVTMASPGKDMELPDLNVGM
jgi:hypothetical protein